MERNSRKLLQLLELDGWQVVRVRGDHHVLKKDGIAELITVPHPKKDLPRGLVRRIYSLARWSLDQ